MEVLRCLGLAQRTPSGASVAGCASTSRARGKQPAAFPSRQTASAPRAVPSRPTHPHTEAVGTPRREDAGSSASPPGTAQLSEQVALCSGGQWQRVSATAQPAQPQAYHAHAEVPQWDQPPWDTDTQEATATLWLWSLHGAWLPLRLAGATVRLAREISPQARTDVSGRSVLDALHSARRF